MDELQFLRDLLPESAPPTFDATATARARLTGPAPGRLRPYRTRLWTGYSRPPVWAGAVLVVAAAAALAAVALTGSGNPVADTSLNVFKLPAGAAGPGPGTVAAGRRILLTAARAVALGGSVASGRYWESPAIAGNFIPVGHGDDQYLILEKTINDQFMARSPRAWSPQLVQQLSVELASPADRAAWWRAGSPRIWHVDQEYGLATPQGPSIGEMFAVTAGRDRLPFVIGASSGFQPFVIGSRALSASQLLRLPAAPGPLRRLLLSGYPDWPGGVSSYLFQTVPAVLDMPVTPAVRSALYRMLAELPGVRSAGEVSDVAGQKGLSVTLTGKYAPCGHYSLGHFVRTGGFTWLRATTRQGKHIRVREPKGRTVGGWMFSSCVVQQRLVINPVSGLPMAQELRYVRLPAGQAWSAPGGLFSYEIFGIPHWANAVPRTNPHGR